jgi:hypothetical protein
MNLLKIHVLTDAEELQILIDRKLCTSIDDIKCDEVDFDWDYHQIALVNSDTQERILWNDNIHSQIEDDIENIIYGMTLVGEDVSVKEIVMFESDVLEKFTGVVYR